MRCQCLALGVLLLGAMCVFADEEAEAPKPSKWSRYFQLPTFKKPAKSAHKEHLVASRPVSQSTLNQQAMATLLRRQAALQKFREIAAATGDQELERKATQLDQRIWEFYLHKTGSPPPTQMSGVDQQVFSSRLGLDHLQGGANEKVQASTRKEMP